MLSVMRSHATELMTLIFDTSGCLCGSLLVIVDDSLWSAGLTPAATGRRVSPINATLYPQIADSADARTTGPAGIRTQARAASGGNRSCGSLGREAPLFPSLFYPPPVTVIAVCHMLAMAYAEHGQGGPNKGWTQPAQVACGRNTPVGRSLGLATARRVRWSRTAREASLAMAPRGGTTRRASSASAMRPAGTPAPAPPPPRNRCAGLPGTAARNALGPT